MSQTAPEPAWTDVVEWQTADVLDPGSWRDALNGCEAVHVVDPVSFPLPRGSPRSGAVGDRERDAAIVAALETERAGVDSFVLLSITGPLATHSHHAVRRRTERAIDELEPRTTVLRLGPIYGEGNSHPPLFNTAMRLVDEHAFLAERFGGVRPLPLDSVARTALQAGFDPDTPAIIDPEMIARATSSTGDSNRNK